MTSAQDYVLRGWVPVPVPHRRKAPGRAGWQNRTLESAKASLEQDFPADYAGNVGVLLGAPSNWLVDVDLDHEHALVLAPAFLPPTVKFGRASKPRSHWLYRCVGAVTSKRDKVEIRSTGGQTVFPGSVHESGEAVEWCDAREPAEVTADVLGAAVDRLRAACAVAEHVPPAEARERHEFFLKLSGALAHLGWLEGDASAFVEAVCAAVGADPKHHAQGVADTYQRRRDGVQVSGVPKLVEAGVPSKAVNSLRRCSPQGDDRNAIYWGPGRERTAADAVIEDLAREHDVFQRDGCLVTPAGGTLQPMTKAVLRERVDAASRLVKMTDEGPRACAPPVALVAAVHERRTWAGVKTIKSIVCYPVLRPDGTIAVEQGYDEPSGAWLHDVPKVQVPDEPTLDDAQRAVAVLHHPVSQFPWDGEPGLGLSVWMALVLTLLARPAIAGSVPSWIFDATQSRSGKSLLVKAAGAIVLGKIPPETNAPKSDQDEWDKLLRTASIEAWPLLFLDNVTGKLKSSALEAFVTSGGAVRGRILGESRSTYTGSCPTVVAVTSNNATLGTDMVGRSLHCRINPRVQDPGLRTGWECDPLEDWVLEHRGELLGAACTVLRAHAVAGRPAEGARLGGFEAWCKIVGSALAWTGLPDPASSQGALREASDEETDALGLVLTAWREQFGSKPRTAAEALRDAQPELRGAFAEWADTEFLTSIKLGIRIQKVRGRVAAGLNFEIASKHAGTTHWCVVPVGGG